MSNEICSLHGGGIQAWDRKPACMLRPCSDDATVAILCGVSVVDSLERLLSTNGDGSVVRVSRVAEHEVGCTDDTTVAMLRGASVI